MKSDKSKKYTYHAGDSKAQSGRRSAQQAPRQSQPSRSGAQPPAAFTEPIEEAAIRKAAPSPAQQDPAHFAPAQPPATPAEPASPARQAQVEPARHDEAPSVPRPRAKAYDVVAEAPPEQAPRENEETSADFGTYEAYYGKEYANGGTAAPAYTDGERVESESAAAEEAQVSGAQSGYAEEHPTKGQATARENAPRQPLVDMPQYDLDYFAKDAGRQSRKQAAQRPAGGSRPAGKGRPVSKGRKVVRYIARTVSVVVIVLIAAVALVFGAITVVCKGPFPTAQALFVNSVNETSAVKFLARIYFSEEQVQEILAANAVMPTDEVTDLTQPFEEPTAEEASSEPIEIVDINGATYMGKMMIIKDPSRVKLATLPQFGAGINGQKVEDFVAENNATAGFNAGGFDDPNGMGLGGVPLGTLIKDGQILAGSATTACNLIGFTFDNQLLVGSMTGQEALDKGMRDAVYFEPTFIVNGNAVEVSGNGGGLNPRTVIGQRADGAVLVLVIDGRQAHSMGASLQDCMNEMLEAGAINAANLDGGSSSVLIYEGEMINSCASLYGSRGQPAAWIVE